MSKNIHLAFNLIITGYKNNLYKNKKGADFMHNIFIDIVDDIITATGIITISKWAAKHSIRIVHDIISYKKRS